MNLCVFQGTFNPFHSAHLRVVKYVERKYDFDKILIIPAYKPPHKDYDDNLSSHRLNIAKIAIEEENNPKIEVSDIEYKRNDKSYTYITINQLYKNYDISDKISFIIGTDAFADIESWYETDKLKNLVRFIVFEREEGCDFSKYTYLKDIGYNFICENLTFKDISSTDLRNRIKNNENYEQFVGKKVKEYIEKNELYK